MLQNQWRLITNDEVDLPSQGIFTLHSAGIKAHCIAVGRIAWLNYNVPKIWHPILYLTDNLENGVSSSHMEIVLMACLIDGGVTMPSCVYCCRQS